MTRAGGDPLGAIVDSRELHVSFGFALVGAIVGEFWARARAWDC